MLNLVSLYAMNNFLFREKDLKSHLIDYYLQHQPKEIVQYVKEFNFQFSDFTDEDMTLLIDMLIDSKDVYSQHKINVGETRQKIHVKLESNAKLKRQRPSKVQLHLTEIVEKLVYPLKDADIIREM